MFYLVFGLVPLLGFTLFRAEIAFFQAPLSALLLVIIFTLRIFLNDNIRISNEKYYSRFLFFLIFLICLLIINTFPYAFSSVDIMWAVKSIIRLIISLIIFVTLSSFLPNDEKLIEKFISVYILSSSILIAIYLYRYVSHSVPFLAPAWDLTGGGTTVGKNSLGFYVSVTSTIVFWRYVSKNATSFWIIPLVIHLCALVYIQSRSSWLAFFLGIFTVIILFNKRLKYSTITSFPYFSRIVIMLGGIVIFYLFILGTDIQNTISLRFSSINSVLSGDVSQWGGSAVKRY